MRLYTLRTKSTISRHLTSFLLAMLVMTVLSVTAFAQVENGQISGIVTDPSGAVVPGAKVSATSLDRGTKRDTVTSGSGTYTLTGLQPGEWEVTVEGASFAKTKRNVNVTVGARITADFKLSVSTTSTVVEVVGQEALQVDTQTPEVSQVVTGKQLTELPTLTRDPYALVATAGNIQEDPKTTNTRGVGFSMNGQRSASTDIMLDGAENVSLFTASVGQTVPLESVAEYRVITNNYGAEYGRASGGIVNVVTKSGTNAFHGNAYEFNRLSAYTANTYDNNAQCVTNAAGVCTRYTPTPKGKYTRNQFGYSIGGPIAKNKLFFFNSTEWTRVRSNAVVQATIPDSALIALTNANTQTFFNAFGKKRAGLQTVNVLSWGSVLGGLGIPAATPAFDVVSYSAPSDAGGGNPRNDINSLVRLDYNFTDRTTIFARYGVNQTDFFPGTINNSPYAGFDTGETDLNQNFLLSLMHSFSSNVVNQSKVTFNRLNQLQPLGANPVGPTLYITGAGLQLGGQSVAFPGYSEFTPGNAIPFGGPQNVLEFNDDLSWTRGKHTFRFGGAYVYTKDDRAFGAYEEAVETLGTNKTNGLTNFVNGQLRQFQAAVFPQGKFPCVVTPTGTTIQTPACTLTLPVGPPQFDRSNRYHDVGLYVADAWKVKPGFTIDLGLRWEYYGVQHNSRQNLDSNLYFGSGATLVQQIKNGQVFTVPTAPNHHLWEPQWRNFAPRVGFAWDVFGDGKTSLRGGYGIAYERNFNNVTFNVIQNPPNYAVISLLTGTDVATNPITTSNSGPLAGTSGTKAFPRPSLRYVRTDIKTAYTQFWSFGVQRELARNTVLALDYNGAHAIHQYSISNFNKPGFGVLYGGTNPNSAACQATAATLAACDRDRLNDQYGNINTRGSDGFNYYSALNVRLSTDNLFKQGLGLGVNYTYAHAIDNLSSTFSEGTQESGALGQLDPFRPSVDKGDADYDARHRLSLNAIWALPYAKNTHGWVKQVLDGWSLVPVWTARTGYPFAIFDCTNQIDTTSCGRLIAASGFVKSGTTSRPTGGPNVFNYLAYPTSGVGSYASTTNGGISAELPQCPAIGSNPLQCNFPTSMTHRNAFRMPGVWNFNFGVYKDFKLTERFGLQFRTEMYNAFNHSNFYVLTGGNGGNADVSGLNGFIQGKKGTDLDPGGFINERRFIQFALKLKF